VSPNNLSAFTDFVTHNQQVAEQTLDIHATLVNNKLWYHFKKQKMRTKWMKKILTLPVYLPGSENFLFIMSNCSVSNGAIISKVDELKHSLVIRSSPWSRRGILQVEFGLSYLSRLLFCIADNLMPTSFVCYCCSYWNNKI